MLTVIDVTESRAWLVDDRAWWESVSVLVLIGVRYREAVRETYKENWSLTRPDGLQVHIVQEFFASPDLYTQPPSLEPILVSAQLLKGRNLNVTTTRGAKSQGYQERKP